jgi:hypothetical protein
MAMTITVLGGKVFITPPLAAQLATYVIAKKPPGERGE